MNENTLLNRWSQAVRKAPTAKTLSCTSCRQRKVKCNRLNPCEPCLKLGIECIFPTRRVRAPRGPLAWSNALALEPRDAELLHRIWRLEQMLAQKIDKPPRFQGGRLHRRSNLARVSPTSKSTRQNEAQPAFDVDNHYRAFIKQQGSVSRHLNGDFWSSLNNELDDLQQLIQGHVEDEEQEHSGPPLASSMEESGLSPNSMLQGAEMFDGSESAYSSADHRETLFRFYFSNVDPVCKILHRPTVDTYFSDFDMLLDPSSGRIKVSSFEAVTFAYFFAAVTNMSRQDCLADLGGEKHILSSQFRHRTEAALVRADYMNSLEIGTLQALTIFTVSTSH